MPPSKKSSTAPKPAASSSSTGAITVNSEPRRIVSVLGFRSPTDRNQWRDDIRDLRAALKAAKAAAERKGQAWRDLVACGVIEALCLGAIEYERRMLNIPFTKLGREDNTSDDPLNDQVYFKMYQPWWMAISVIYEGLAFENDTVVEREMGSVTTRRIFSAVRKYWVKMTERFWKDTTEKSVQELATISGLLVQFMRMDQTFVKDITDKSGDLTLCLICRGLRYAESPEAKIVHTNSWANFMSCLEIIPTHDDDAPSTPPNMLTISPDHDFGGRMKDGYKIVARILKGFGGDSISEAKMQALIRHLQENDITPFHASFNFNAKQIHILFGSCQFERPDSPRGLEILRRTKAYHKFRNAVLFSVPHWKLQFQSFRELDKESRGHAGIEEANKEVMIMSFAPLVTELAAPLLMPVPENGTMAKLALAWLEAGIIDPVEKMAVYNTSTVQDETSTAMTIMNINMVFLCLNAALDLHKTRSLTYLTTSDSPPKNPTSDLPPSALAMLGGTTIPVSVPVTRHLPRPVLLHRLLLRDIRMCFTEMKRTSSPTPGEIITLPFCKGDDGGGVDGTGIVQHGLHRGWITLVMLHAQERVMQRCGRFECDKKKSSQERWGCERCKRVRYCGEECRKLDAEDHNPVCGLRVWVNDKEIGVPGSVGTRERDPWPSEITQSCGQIRLVWPGQVTRTRIRARRAGS